MRAALIAMAIVGISGIAVAVILALEPCITKPRYDPAKGGTATVAEVTTWIWPGVAPHQRIDTTVIKGHEYLVHNLGGIIHAASCTNATCLPVTLEQLQSKPPIYGIVPTTSTSPTSRPTIPAVPLGTSATTLTPLP